MAERRAGVGRWLEGAGPGSWALLGAALWAALALLGALAGMGGRIAPAPLPPGTPLPAQQRVPPDRIGPYAQYREAELRPLFATDRRPRPFLVAGSQAAAAAGQAQPLNLQLTGVLISPRVQLATVQAPGGQPERVRLGQVPESAGGWRLVSLAPRSAVFEGPEGRRTLELAVSGVAAAPAPPPAPPPAAPAEPPPSAIPGQDDGPDAAEEAAQAAAEVAEAAASAQTPEQAREQIEAIRQRIQARRAQIQRDNADGTPPPTP